MSLYADYVKERLGRGTIETEDGFATFEYLDEDTVYIVDLYVVPEKRKSNIAAKMADKVMEEAIKVGKKFMMGTVDTTTKHAEVSCKVLEAYGMKIYQVVGPTVFYFKDIGPQTVEKVV